MPRAQRKERLPLDGRFSDLLGIRLSIDRPERGRVGVDARRDPYARKGVVNTETIKIDGVETVTLKELLRPGLRPVLVGINPSPISVATGHYYKGRLGQRFWGRLQSAGIASDLSMGLEDDAALEQGLGFADVVRRPTPRSIDASDAEMSEGAESLVGRLRVAQGAVVVSALLLCG